MKEMGPATTEAHRSRGKVQMGMLSQKEIRTSLIAEVGEHVNYLVDLFPPVQAQIGPLVKTRGGDCCGARCAESGVARPLDGGEGDW